MGNRGSNPSKGAAKNTVLPDRKASSRRAGSTFGEDFDEQSSSDDEWVVDDLDAAATVQTDSATETVRPTVVIPQSRSRRPEIEANRKELELRFNSTDSAVREEKRAASIKRDATRNSVQHGEDDTRPELLKREHSFKHVLAREMSSTLLLLQTSTKEAAFVERVPAGAALADWEVTESDQPIEAAPTDIKCSECQQKVLKIAGRKWHSLVDGNFLRKIYGEQTIQENDSWAYGCACRHAVGGQERDPSSKHACWNPLNLMEPVGFDQSLKAIKMRRADRGFAGVVSTAVAVQKAKNQFRKKDATPQLAFKGKRQRVDRSFAGVVPTVVSVEKAKNQFKKGATPQLALAFKGKRQRAGQGFAGVVSTAVAAEKAKIQFLRKGDAKREAAVRFR